MKKLMPFIGGALLIAFAVGVFVIVVSLSFRALGYVFPADLFDQVVGLLLFDLAALVWFTVFVYRCESMMQYTFALFGFLLGLAGVIGLVAIEVGISSGAMKAEDMLAPLTYVFIVSAVGHLIFLYLHHGSAPHVNARISLGVEKAKIQEEGMRQAEQELDLSRAEMGKVIRESLVAEVRRDLNMAPRVIDGRVLPVNDDLHVPTNGWPTREASVDVAPLSLRGVWERARGAVANVFPLKVDGKQTEPAVSVETPMPEASVREPAPLPADNAPIGDVPSVTA